MMLARLSWIVIASTSFTSGDSLRGANARDSDQGNTSSMHAPWFVIPSALKLYRNLAISQLLVEAMEGLNMKYPKPSFDPATLVLD